MSKKLIYDLAAGEIHSFAQFISC